MDTYTGLEFIKDTTTPVLIISAVGLLALALYNRLAVLIARLRVFHKELLELSKQMMEQKRDPQSEYGTFHASWSEMQTTEIQKEIGIVFTRTLFLKGALLAIWGAVALVGFTVMALAIEKSYRTSPVLVLFPYFLAWTCITIACGFAIAELVKAREAVKSETDLVDRLFSHSRHSGGNIGIDF
eukprot:TRINITY_DN6853_c0_g1_i1.p1 TRINITY_DN6853_c0_g1~~TRINITY_DN6853_c0_g1_i1.p1  ORF type:complete len:184 (-),score=18.82 TRINITY_DN6853_c0_g1_i1:15-566(-)